MASLSDHDRRTREATSPADRLCRAIELMAAGLHLQRANLARRNPEASPQELERMFRDWLMRDDG